MAGHLAAAAAISAGFLGMALLAAGYAAAVLARFLAAAALVLNVMGAVALATGAGASLVALWQGLLRSDLRASFEDDGWRRILAFFIKVLPVLAHYKVMDWRTRGKSDAEVDAATRVLHARYAPWALAVCQEMQGFYIKIGQMAAGAGTGVMPKEYVEELAVLLEDCPPREFEVIRAIVESDIGPLAEIFESFDEWPLHTASIGQVHGARLHGGTEVVVKVQLPGAEKNFRIDVECFLQLARLCFREHVDELMEIKRNFVTEFDYAKEATQMREAHSFLRGFSDIVVPLPVESWHTLGQQEKNSRGLFSRRVLVMERLAGKSLARWGLQVLDAMAANQGLTREEVLVNLQDMSPDEVEQMKPSALAVWLYTTGKQATDVACSAASTAYSISAPLRAGLGFGLQSFTTSAFEWMADSISTASSSSTQALPSISFDLYKLPETLFRVQAHLLFEAGFVNTDPHPGNIMFLDDGRLGLIDWGQVKRLSPDQRSRLARAVIAVADEDEVLAANCMRAMGMRTAKDLDWTYSRQAFFFLASWTDERVVELGGPIKVEEVLGKLDRVIEGVGDFWMPMRNQFFTRQCLAMLGFPRVNSAQLLRPAAVRFLEGQMQPIPRTVRRTAPPPPGLRAVLGHHDKSD